MKERKSLRNRARVAALTRRRNPFFFLFQPSFGIMIYHARHVLYYRIMTLGLVSAVPDDPRNIYIRLPPKSKYRI